MFEGGETTVAADSFTRIDTLPSMRKKKNKNKRRFSDEQIKSLESMFESETKLEPRKKLQLARELGLQPRQVAIWFQNKRARWKSKQIEHDYSILLSNYNVLASRFENLKKEKQSLLLQLQKLNEEMEKTRGGTESQSSRSAVEGDSVSKCESELKQSLSAERSELEDWGSFDSDSSKQADYFGIEEEEHKFMNVVESCDGSLSSPEDWSSLDSDKLFDEPNDSYQWWDFWS